MSYPQSSGGVPNTQASSAPDAAATPSSSAAHLTTGAALDAIARSLDPLVQLDDELKAVLLDACDAFVDTLIDKSTDIAAQRGGQQLTADDVNMVLEREMGIFLGGTGTAVTQPPPTEAHLQRMAVIKKTLKKP